MKRVYLNFFFPTSLTGIADVSRHKFLPHYSCPRNPAQVLYVPRWPIFSFGLDLTHPSRISGEALASMPRWATMVATMQVPSKIGSGTAGKKSLKIRLRQSCHMDRLSRTLRRSAGDGFGRSPGPGLWPAAIFYGVPCTWPTFRTLSIILDWILVDGMTHFGLYCLGDYCILESSRPSNQKSIGSFMISSLPLTISFRRGYNFASRHY